MATTRPLHERTLSNAQQAATLRSIGFIMQHAFNNGDFQFKMNKRGTEDNLCKSNEEIFISHDFAACTPHSTSGHLPVWAAEHWSPDQPASMEASV